MKHKLHRIFIKDMSTIEHSAQEIPESKVQRAEPLLREVNTKLRIQMRILQIRNRCKQPKNQQNQPHNTAQNSSKFALTEPGTPAPIPPHQIIPKISKKIQHLVLPPTFQGINDVVMQNRLVQFRNNIGEIRISKRKTVSEKG